MNDLFDSSAPAPTPAPAPASKIPPRIPAFTGTSCPTEETKDWKKQLEELYATIEPLAREAGRRYPYTEIYLYYKPATPDTWGKFWVGHEDPPAGYRLVTPERIGGIPYADIAHRFRPILCRLALIAWQS